MNIPDFNIKAALSKKEAEVLIAKLEAIITKNSDETDTAGQIGLPISTRT